MLTGFAAEPLALGLGPALGPQAAATPAAATDWRNRLRETTTPRSIGASPFEQRLTIDQPIWLWGFDSLSGRALLEVERLRHHSCRRHERIAVQRPSRDVPDVRLRDTDAPTEVAPDDADREHIVDRDLEELLADVDALLIAHTGPALCEQIDGLLHDRRRLLSRLASAAVPGRVGNPHDRRVPAAPGRERPREEEWVLGTDDIAGHLRGVRHDPLQRETARDRLEREIDSDLLPLLLEHLRERREVGYAIDDHEREAHVSLAIFAQAVALGILPGVPDPVEQLIRLRDVERVPLRLPFRAREESTCLGWCWRADRACPQEERLVHLVAIDAQGERAPEVDTAEQLSELGVLVVCEIEGDTDAAFLRVEAHLVPAALLVLDEHRQLGHAEERLLVVELARCRAQRHDLGALNSDVLHHTDVGKLIAVSVHADVVGVALEDPREGIRQRDLHDPRIHDRQLGVRLPAHECLDVRDPPVEFHGLGELVRRLLTHVLRVVSLEVVLRRIPAAPELLPERAAEVVGGRGQDPEEERVGLRRHVPHRVLVDLLDDHLLAVHKEVGAVAGVDLLVVVDVLVPEQDVVGGEWFAIGPLHPTAELHGDDLVVRAQLVGARDVRDDLAVLVVHEEEARRARHEAMAGEVSSETTGDGLAQRAAVLADTVDGLDDELVLPDPLRDRRELALLHERGELWGLLEGLRELRRIRDDHRAFEFPELVSPGGARCRALSRRRAWDRRLRHARGEQRRATRGCRQLQEFATTEPPL